MVATFQTDVEPEVILKKLADSGGAKYSVQQKNAPAQPRDKIAPVGSSYTPVGKVDMGALKSSKPTQSYTPPPPGASFARPNPAPVAPATEAKTFTPPPVKKFTPPVLPPQATARNDDDEADETWGDEPPAPPAPAATPSVSAPKASAPAGSFYKAPTIASLPAKVEVKAESEKPKEVDRIGKVVRFNPYFGLSSSRDLTAAFSLPSQGTAYTPVELPKPKKLVNPFAAAQAQRSTPAPSSAPSSGGAAGAGGGAKLTWSQRQALAKERDAADEARSSQASAAVSRGPLGGVSAAAVGAGVGVALAGEGHGESPSDHEETPAPAAPPRPLFTTRPGAPPAPTAAAADEPEDEGFEEPSPPSSPPPPPKRAIVTNAPPAFPDDEDDFDEPEPTPAPRKVVANAAPAFPDDDDFEEDEPAPPPPAARIPPPAPRAPTPEPETEPAPAPAPKRTSNAISGLRAKVLFDYEKTEDNELQLVEGEILTEVDMIDEGWWSAINSAGESGLFPRCVSHSFLMPDERLTRSSDGRCSNYTEIIEAEEEEAAPAPTPAPPPHPPRPATPEPEPEPEVATGGLIAVAAYECVLSTSHGLDPS